MKYLHLKPRNADGTVRNNGGLTVAYQFDSASRTLEYGYSQCSNKDAFNKALGRKISSGRLIAKRNHFFSIHTNERPIETLLSIFQ